jgi:hypothetical protein
VCDFDIGGGSNRLEPFSDVGASQMIIDGKIKLKNDSLIERFTETGVRFENGSELDADVVIFATGYVVFYCVFKRVSYPIILTCFG